MHGGDLPVAHAAPVRLRVERQLGCKSPKCRAGSEAVERIDGGGPGRGSLLAGFGFSLYAGL